MLQPSISTLFLLIVIAFSTPVLTARSALAADTAPEFTLTIKDHLFSPAELTVPAGQKVKLIVDNQDPTPEEFESHELGREKVIAGGKKATIYIGPLKAGSYPYIGEFHEKTAKGTIIAK